MLKKGRPYFLIFVLGFLLYGQVLFFDFSYFDDQSLILENSQILSSFKNAGEIFINDAFFSVDKYYYRPLLNLSFMFDMNLGGTIPFIYHFSNILIHILVASLIFSLFLKLNYRRELAFFFSLLFLVHPVLTQAVAWIPGRNDSLLALFILASFNLFLLFKDKPKLIYYLGYLSFFLLALFTKETAAFFPFVIIFYLFVFAKEKVTPTDKWLIIFGSLAMGIIWYLFRYLALGSDPVTLKIIITSVLRNSPAFLVSLGKGFLPFNLSVLPILADSKIIYGLVVLPLLVLALFYSSRKDWRYLGFGFLWFFLFLFPSFVRLNPVDTPDFLEHRLYLPIIGLFVILAEIDWVKNLAWQKKTVKLGAAFIIILFFLLSWCYLPVFYNRISFWQSAVSSSPHSALANRNLGAMYYLDNDFERAEKSYRKAIVINENEPMVHNNLGLIYLERNSYGQAEREFKKELSLYPNYDKALFNLGDLYYRQKRLTEASSLWEAALQANPRYYEAYYRLLNLKNQLR